MVGRLRPCGRAKIIDVVNVLEDQKNNTRQVTLSSPPEIHHRHRLLACRRLRDASAPAIEEERYARVLRKYERLCMRFAAECEGLAADAPEPDLREHFLLMASMWTELADLPRVLH